MMQTEKRGAMQAILYGLFIGLVYALVGFNAIICLAALLLKLEYQLIHKLLWLACVCAVLTAALLFCRIGKKSASPFAGALPLYTVSAVLLFVGASGLGAAELILIMINYVLAAVLLARCRNIWKYFLGGLAALTTIPFLLVFGLTVIFNAGFGIETNMEFPSPNADIAAWVHIADEGALGGRTTVTFYRPSERIHLGFAMITRPIKTLNEGWTDPAGFTFQWIDDHAYRFNGSHGIIKEGNSHHEKEKDSIPICVSSADRTVSCDDHHREQFDRSGT